MILFLEITWRCNLNCTYCVRRQMNPEDKIKDMPLEDVKKLCKEINPEIINIIGTGEPFCYPEWDELMKFIKDNKYTLQFTTNGVLLTEERINNLPINSILYFSIDTLNNDRNIELKGSPIDLVVKNIKLLRKLRPDVEINIQPVITKGFTSEFYVFCDLVESVAAGFSPILPTCYDKETFDKIYPSDDEIVEVDRLWNIAQSENKMTKGNPFWTKPTHKICPDPFNIIFVAINGDVYPCCYIYSARPNIFSKAPTFTEHYKGITIDVPSHQYKIGNIYKEDINDLINSERMNSVRYMVATTAPDDFERRGKVNLKIPHEYCRVCLNHWGCGG